MSMFRMNGRAITSLPGFSEYFDPVDLLRGKELAAGFAIHETMKISEWMKYNCVILYKSVFSERLCFESEITDPAEYFRVPPFVRTALGALAPIAVRDKADDTRLLNTAASLLDTAYSTELPPDHRNRLFALLAAGYFIAGRTTSEIPITAVEAEAAYRCKEPAAQNESVSEVFFRDNTLMRLPARTKPYRIEVMSLENFAPSGQSNISFAKILADAHQQGTGNVPLTLELHVSSTGESREVEVRQGDYRYFCIIGEKIAFMYPTESENGDCRMVRDGDRFTLYKSDTKSLEFIYDKKNAVHFVPETHGRGCVIVSSCGLDLDRYDLRNMYGHTMKKNDAVYVTMDGTRCTVTDRDGNNTSNYDT